MEALLSYVDVSSEMLFVGIILAFILGLMLGHFTVKDIFDSDDDKRNTPAHRVAYIRAGAPSSPSLLC